MTDSTHNPLMSEQAERMLKDVSGAYVTVDRDWNYIYVNARAARLFGLRPQEMLGRPVWTEFPESPDATFNPAVRRALAEQTTIEFETQHLPLNLWLECRIHPAPEGLTIFFRDITARKRSEAMVRGQNKILEMVALGADQAQTLEVLLQTLEELSPDMLCSILLMDPDGQHVRHGAGPSLPKAYLQAIDGAPIGSRAGSCGTAIYRGEPVFVADIATDPLWEDYKELALFHGLRSCWSTPILDPQKRVLGSFAIYHRQPGLPSAWQREIIDFATHTAAICIHRQRVQEAMNDAAIFNRQIIAGAREGVVVLDRKLRYLVWNPYMEELLGVSAAHVLGRHPLEVFPWVQEGGQLAALEKALGGETIVLPDNQRIRTGAKRISWVQARLAPLRDGRGEIVGVIVTITDITERKQAEEQLRALANRLQSVREEQSAHLAREIHDVLGQQLTALKLDLAWVKRRSTAISDPELRDTLTQKVTETSALVDDTIRTVQKVATELRPGLLDKLGLAAALEHEAKGFAHRAVLDHALHLAKALPELELNRSIEVFRIYQEILTNIARHARASRFEVRLEHTDGQLQLTVTDDGRGISEKALSGTHSLGLLGMHERTQLLGGTLDIRGAAGKGTVVVLTLPLASPS